MNAQQYIQFLSSWCVEIPTGLFLLRRVSKEQFKSEFPELNYSMFVASSILRITMGYLFLGNVVVILAYAEGVVEIFYDVLALQFIQQLDDIVFALSKMDVLGKRMHRATMMPYFRAEFQKREKSTVLKRRIKVFLKAVYFLNLAGFLAVMIVISTRQINGHYQCKSITVRCECTYSFSC